MINNELTDALAAGRAHGIGLWKDDRLVAVASWSQQDVGIWICDTIAVRMGHAHRKYAAYLKQQVLARAREAGVHRVASFVHYDNDRMIDINKVHNARMRRHDDGIHVICTIDL